MWEYLFKQILNIKYNSLKDDAICLDKYKLNIRSMSDVFIFWKFIINKPEVDSLLHFMLSRQWISLSSIVELALDLGHWKFLREVQETYSLDIYFGNPKYHFNEVIVLKFLKNLRNGRECFEIIEIMNKISNFKKHQSREISIQIIETYKTVSHQVRFEIGHLQRAKSAFVFFKEKEILSEGDQFSIFKQIVNSQNFNAIDLWSEYVNFDSSCLFLDVADYSFLKIAYDKYFKFFKKRNYIHTLVKVHFNKNKIPDLINSLNFLVDKSLIEVKEDVTLIKWISNSKVDAVEKMAVTNQLVRLGFLPHHELLYKNHKYPDSLIAVLSKGNSLPVLSRIIIGAKSSKAQMIVKDLISTIEEKESQNAIIFYEFMINQLSINRDFVLKTSPFFIINFSTESLNKLKYIMMQFPMRTRLRLMTGINVNQTVTINEIFEVISCINSEPIEHRNPLPEKPRSLQNLMEQLVYYKTNVQKQNISFGLDTFAKELESKRFQEYEIKVPKNALELAATGFSFNNCLRDSYHSKYVTDILHRKLVIISIHSLYQPKTKYCISIDLENEKVSEAKAEGQVQMSEELVFCFDLFLKDFNYGKKWI